MSWSSLPGANPARCRDHLERQGLETYLAGPIPAQPLSEEELASLTARATAERGHIVRKPQLAWCRWDGPGPRTEPACWRLEVSEEVAQQALQVTTQQDAVGLMEDWQEEHCAVCGKDQGRRGGHLVTDHDHNTGLVRGMLCRSCNSREGHADYEPFLGYRLRNPASILGLSIPYSGMWWVDGKPLM